MTPFLKPSIICSLVASGLVSNHNLNIFHVLWVKSSCRYNLWILSNILTSNFSMILIVILLPTSVWFLLWYYYQLQYDSYCDTSTNFSMIPIVILLPTSVWFLLWYYYQLQYDSYCDITTNFSMTPIVILLPTSIWFLLWYYYHQCEYVHIIHYGWFLI